MLLMTEHRVVREATREQPTMGMERAENSAGMILRGTVRSFEVRDYRHKGKRTCLFIDYFRQLEEYMHYHLHIVFVG